MAAAAIAPHLKASVEYNEDGTFYFKFPPFPKAPAGITLIPFSKFEDCGVKDGVDMDGRGVRTVQLGVKHDNDAPARKKTKKKRNALGQWIGSSPQNWWDEWPDPDVVRVANVAGYHTRIASATERIELATNEFFDQRAWPHLSTGVTQLFDQFRLFMGLIGDGMQTIYRKAKKEDEDEEEEDDFDDEDPAGPVISQEELAKRQKVDSVPVEEAEPSVPSEGPHRRPPKEKKKLVTKEERLESFASHVEFSIRVFLSSYFRDKGMYWSDVKLKDGPIIVLHYLKFLRSHRVLPEMADEINRAVEVTEKAVAELPCTKKMGAVLPDELSEGCVKLFGKKARRILWSDGDDQEDPKPATKVDESQTQAEESVSSKPDSWGAPGNWGIVDADQNGWGAPEFDAGADVDIGWGGEPMEINHEEDASSKWLNPNPGWDSDVKDSLFKLIGPSSFPLTHTIGYVEGSVRRILSWKMPPDPKSKDYVPGALESMFATVIMEPWGSWDDDERAAVRPPDLIESAPEELGLYPHNPKKSNIRLLVLPKVAETLVKGMGLGGIWVQVVPTEGKGSDKDKKNWWYLENLDQILVSYWTEA